MKYALYAQSAEQIDQACPYCGSEDLTNSDLGAPTAAKCNNEVTCGDCGRSHHIGYTATRLTLESSADPPDLLDFYLPVAVLQDQRLDDPSQSAGLPVGIHASPDGLIVMAHGYGDHDSAAGYGAPLIVELYDGRLRLIAWDDINREDPPVIVNLEQAAESVRQETDPFQGQRLDREGRLVESHDFDDLTAAVEYAQTLDDIPGHAGQVVDARTGVPVAVREASKAYHCPECGFTQVVPDADLPVVGVPMCADCDRDLIEAEASPTRRS